MPWFRNKETGLEWYVSDPEHARRLEADPAYERVEREVPAARPAATEPEAPVEPEDEQEPEPEAPASPKRGRGRGK